MTVPASRSLHAPHPFTLRQLQYVRAVAELRSFPVYAGLSVEEIDRRVVY